MKPANIKFIPSGYTTGFSVHGPSSHLCRIVSTGLLLLCLSIVCPAQENRSTLWLETLEELTDGAETNWEDELEEWADLQNHPIDINHTSKKELQKLPFLTDLQIENILAYVYQYGALASVQELQLIPEMDKRTLEKLRLFVCIKPVRKETVYPSLKNIVKYGRHEIITRLDQPLYTRKGYRTAYLGPKQYHSLRYQFKYGDSFQCGFSGEKDAGEPMFALQNQKGYDHYSYFIQIRKWKWIDNLVVGNYRAHFGMGLVLGNGFLTGKSSTMATADYQPTGIRKTNTTDEFNYFSGIATTLQLSRKLQTTFFYSNRLLDGTLKDNHIVSIYKSGLHRTQKEIDKIHRFRQQCMGGHVNYEANRWQVGITGLYHFFSKEYRPNLRKYSQYDLQGNHFYNIGIDYQLRLGRFKWSGEAAVGKHGQAFINQLLYSFSPSTRLRLIHRYYTYDYWGYYARAFSESSVKNENGWYLAGEVSPWAHWTFFASADLFSFPWWKYRVSKPSKGVDILSRATFVPNRQWNMYATYRFKQKERDITGSKGEKVTMTNQHKARYRLSYQQGAWQLQTTFDYTYFVQEGCTPSQGYLASQSANYVLPHTRLSLNVQGCYFHTDGYDSRVYSYEKGLLYTFYIPSYFGQGFHYAAHVQYDFNDHIRLIARGGETIYQNRTSISSGNDLIASNRKADLQFQLRIKF